MNKIFNRLFVFLIFILLTFGCITDNGQKNNNNDTNNNNQYEGYKYLVQIKTSSDNNFTLIIPLVINLDYKDISQIMFNLNFTGIGNYTIENTKHGPGLNVSGKGNVTIESKGNTYVDWGILSLKYDSDGDGMLWDEGNDVEYWYYFESRYNISINLEIMWDVNHERGVIYCEIPEITIYGNGWNRTYGAEIHASKD